MKPNIVIEGGSYFSYYCESAIPIEEINGTILTLNTSNSCHFFCKNNNCDNKKNIVELQKEYHRNMMCKICEKNKIEWGFFLIIHKLRKEGLLPKNFVCVCCKCYNLIGEEECEKIMSE